VQWRDFLYPPTCPSCGEDVWHEGEWCKICFEELYDVRKVTDLAGEDLAYAYVIGHYDKGLKSILRDIKFQGKKERAIGAAPFLYSFMLALDEDILTADYVVPIPVSDSKRRIRGYNQVDILFKKWVQAVSKQITKPPCHWQWLEALHKVDSTQAMFSLGRTERHENMKHAFTAIPEVEKSKCLKDKRIMIVDDIFTTGATLEAAAKILVTEYGAAEVMGLALAGGH